MTSRGKNILLVVSFLLLCFIAYQFSIRKTLALKENITTLEDKASQTENFRLEERQLNQKQSYLDSILVSHNLRNTSVQNNLLDFLNQQAIETNVSIQSFNEPHSVEINNRATISYQFMLEGPFNELQELLFKLDKTKGFGVIKNVHFEKKRNYRSAIEYIECSVIITTSQTRIEAD